MAIGGDVGRPFHRRQLVAERGKVRVRVAVAEEAGFGIFYVRQGIVSVFDVRTHKTLFIRAHHTFFVPRLLKNE